MNPPMTNKFRLTGLGGLWLLFLAGCAPMGPDFVQPEAPAVQRYTETPMPGQTTGSTAPKGETQSFAQDQDIPAEWWALFHSKVLTDLIQTGLKNSPTVAAAQAALENAGQYAVAQRDSLMFPAVDATLGETRQRFSPAAFGFPGNSSTFSLTNASVGVSYTLDFFGANRRQLEGLDAQVQMEGFLLKAARETLAANIVTTAIRDATLRAQIHSLEAVAASEAQTLEIFRTREKLGALSQTEVQQQQASFAQAQAAIPELQKELALTRHQLAVYVGHFPGEGGLPEFSLEELQLPRQLPVSLPSQLVRQRPDILVSEARLHQATANLGLTIASVFPNVTLSASAGAMAVTPGNVFDAASSVWSLGTNLTQPLFHAGALEAGQRAAQAALDQAAAQYRQTVLNAFQNVADVLRALESDAKTLSAQSDNAEAIRRSLQLAKSQYDTGSISLLNLLSAQERDHQAQIALIQAQSSRLADSAALFLAMGGGWWNAVEPAPSLPATGHP